MAHVSRPTVVLMPGDGIGRHVLPEAVRVLDAVGFEADYVEAEIGWDCWVRDGEPLPPATVETLERHRLGLLGAVTSKPEAHARRELAPALRASGVRYRSPILELRRRLGLDLCVRPLRTFPGNPRNFVRRGAETLEEPRIDVVVFRQNTECLYPGVEWTDPPAAVRAGLGTHPRFAPWADVPGRDLAVTVRIVTRDASRRLFHAAFTHAARHGYRSVTVCEKPGVLRETSGMMCEVAEETARAFPEIELHFLNIDAQLLQLTKSPEAFGVIAAGNMFGDIVSDAFAGLVGGMGFAPSANLGPDAAVFEPVHGSAPKYAACDPSIANPLAMILTAALLLDHVGEADRARAVRDAVARVVSRGTCRTFDMAGIRGGPGAVTRGAATTRAMTDAVLACLRTAD